MTQAIKDAIADAETFAINSPSQAWWSGAVALSHLHAGRVHMARQTWVAAARFAFSAVPELRG